MTILSGCAAACLAVIVLVVALGSGGSSQSGGGDDRWGQNDNHQTGGGEDTYPGDASLLSESCDYILCTGTDVDGNYYELVANQKESSRGFEITVGVIKNNQWIYPLSSDFPFLGEDGLFHVSVSLAGESGTSLTHPNSVIKNLYFIDSGGFMLEGYTATGGLDIYDHTRTIFSCSTLKAYTINYDDYRWVLAMRDPSFSDGQVRSYGFIQTDNGKLVMEKTIHNRPSIQDDDEYEIYIFDARNLTSAKIAGPVQVHPLGSLSEGLVLASDHCFYNTSWKKVIDLSDYKFVSVEEARFENGYYVFIARNSIDTKFEVTIDKQGNVISENPL